MGACPALHPDHRVRCRADGHAHPEHYTEFEGYPYWWPNEDYVAPPKVTRSSKASSAEKLTGLMDRVREGKRADEVPAEVGAVHHFDGETYDPESDGIRLNEQALRVWGVIRSGQWLTLSEISATTGDPEASVSARLRDLRKDRFGSFEIDRRRRGRSEDGLFEYRLTGRRVVGQPAEEV